MKRKTIFLVIVIFIFLGSEFIQKASGNPIPVYIGELPIVRVISLIGMFFLGVLVEYAYFKSRISKKLIFLSTNYRLFLKVNLVTFPLTQILAYFFFIFFSNFFWYYVFLIEIGVVFTESLLLRIEFQKLTREEVSSIFIVRNTILANFFSFLLGLLAFIPSIF